MNMLKLTSIRFFFKILVVTFMIPYLFLLTACSDSPSTDPSAGNAAPIVSIIAPSDGDRFDWGDSITFSATSIDEEDGDLSHLIQWSSDVDGHMGDGSSFIFKPSVATHVVTAAIENSKGLMGQSRITIHVIDPSSPPLPGSDRINISLKASRTRCVAPCGVMFNATDTTSKDFSAPFYELRYVWNFNDTGAHFINRPQVNANKSVSPIAGHVFTHPGSFRVALTVTDSNGEVATAFISIEVQDPERTFEKTFCVSNQNAFAECPTQDENFHLSSFGEAREVMGSLRFTLPTVATRVLFKAGEIFETSSERVSVTGLSVPLMVGSYGEGNTPIVQVNETAAPSSIFYLAGNDNITITRIHFKGAYDPTTGTGSHPMGIFIYVGSENTTIYQNKFSGLGLNIYPHGGTHSTSGKPSRYQMIVDNEISNWQDYAVLGNFGHLSTLQANVIRQHRDAISGNEGKCGSCVPNYPDHGGLRSALPDHLLVQYNDIFNNAGWSSAGLAHQPALRLGTNGRIIKSVVSNNTLTGGFNTLEMLPANNDPGTSATIGEIVIERNRFMASDNTTSLINSSLGGVVIRNNLFFKPDNGAPSIGTSSFKSAIIFGSSNTSQENLTHSNHIYNNTLNSQARSSAPNLAFLQVNSHFTTFHIHNNLVYMPFINGNADAGLISWKHFGDLNKVLANHNLIFGPQSLNHVWNNGLSLNLAAWREMGKGAFSMSTDPLLRNPDQLDGELSQHSPAIDSGAGINGLFADYTDKIRDLHIDIGAYEF